MLGGAERVLVRALRVASDVACLRDVGRGGANASKHEERTRARLNGNFSGRNDRNEKPS